jgi:hypothetical protein
VFRLAKDAVLFSLGHPVIHQALNQFDLFKEEKEIDVSMKGLEEELNRHRQPHEDMRGFLEQEEKRVLEQILPNR